MKTKDDVIEELRRKLNTMETSVNKKDNVKNRLSNKVRELEESYDKIGILEGKFYVLENVWKWSEMFYQHAFHA